MTSKHNLREYTATMLARIGFDPKPSDGGAKPPADMYFAAVKTFNEALYAEAAKVYGDKAGAFVANAIQAMLAWSVIHGSGQTTLMAIPENYRYSVMDLLKRFKVDALVKNATPILAAFVNKAIEENGEFL